MNRALNFLLCIFLIVCCNSIDALALSNKFNLQFNWDASVPMLGLGVPIANGDYLEIGYGCSYYKNDVSIYYPIMYSKELRSSEKDRTALKIGAMLTHSKGDWLFRENATFPILLLEQEWSINGNISWELNGGLPYFFGLGLKWYI